MYDDAWSTSVSNQLTVLDDNLLALHLAKFAVRQRQRWLLVQVGLMLELLMKWLLGRVMLLMLITKILIVVVVVGATAILMMTICVVVLVVSSVVLTVVLLLIMATDEVIVLVVRWNRSTRCTASCRSCRRRWWRYQYVVLIFRKVQIVVDVVVVAAVELLLQDTVGVLDRNWLVTTAVCTVKVLILFQLVNQRTSLLLRVTTSNSTLMVLMVVLQYPCSWTTVIVQLLIGLMRVVIVVTAGTVGWFQLHVLAAAAATAAGLMVLVLGRNSLLRRYGVVVQRVEIRVVVVV